MLPELVFELCRLLLSLLRALRQPPLLGQQILARTLGFSDLLPKAFTFRLGFVAIGDLGLKLCGGLLRLGAARGLGLKLRTGFQQFVGLPPGSLLERLAGGAQFLPREAGRIELLL